jgi:hypothetical protein
VFLTGGSGTTVRHITQITHHSQTKHSTQNYTHNKGHTTQNEHNKYSYNYKYINWFWIGWLELLTTPLQSLVITINLQPNPSSLTAEDSLHSHFALILFCTIYIASTWIHRKTRLRYSCIYSVVTYQRKWFDCCLRICCRGNVFTESLPSNGPTYCYSDDWGKCYTFVCNAVYSRCLPLLCRIELPASPALLIEVSMDILAPLGNHKDGPTTSSRPLPFPSTLSWYLEFHVALRASHAALPLVTSKFCPNVALPMLVQFSQQCSSSGVILNK